MRRGLIIIGLLFVLGGLFASPARAVRQYEPSPYIFRLKISGCVQSPGRQIAQTGFRVKGFPGIITALHGVVGCKTITAIAETGPLFSDLSIVQVDIDHDAALLASPDQAMSADEGLAGGDPRQLKDNDILHLVGYPETATFAIRRNTQPPEMRPLYKLLQPGDMTTSITNRNSPNPQVDILWVQVSMMHGDSGAPLLDEQNKVDAIADGGWDDGKVQIGWAIPFSEINFQGVDAGDVKTRLRQLGSQDPAKAPVFSMTMDAGPVQEVTVKTTTLQSSPSARLSGTMRFIAGSQSEGVSLNYMFLDNLTLNRSSMYVSGDALPTLWNLPDVRAITFYKEGQKFYASVMTSSNWTCEDLANSAGSSQFVDLADSVAKIMDTLVDFAFPKGGAGSSQGEFQGVQTIRGISTNHYTFDPETINSANNNTPGLTSLGSDAWLAASDNYNYAVQLMTLAQVKSLQVGEKSFSGSVELTLQFVEVDQNPSIPIPVACTNPGTAAAVPTTDINQPSNPLHQDWIAINQAEMDIWQNGSSSKAWDVFRGAYRYALEDQVSALSDQGMYLEAEFDDVHSHIQSATLLGDSSASLNTCEYWRWQLKDTHDQVVDQSRDYPSFQLVPRTIIATQLDTPSGPQSFITDEYPYEAPAFCK